MYSYGTIDFELKGKNIVSKLFCGIANWIGHILSDIAGYGTFCGVDFGGALISSKGKFDIEYLDYIFNLKYYFSIIYIYYSITFVLFFVVKINEKYCIGSGPKRLDFYKILLQHHQR